MTGSSQLLAYQRRLVELLRSGAEPSSIIAALRDDPELLPLAEQTGSFQPLALAVARRLVETWSED